MKYILLMLVIFSANASQLDKVQKLQRDYQKEYILNNIVLHETISVDSYLVTGVVYPKAYIYTKDRTYVTYNPEIIKSLPDVSEVEVNHFVYGRKVIHEIK